MKRGRESRGGVKPLPRLIQSSPQRSPLPGFSRPSQTPTSPETTQLADLNHLIIPAFSGDLLPHLLIQPSVIPSIPMIGAKMQLLRSLDIPWLG